MTQNRKKSKGSQKKIFSQNLPKKVTKALETHFGGSDGGLGPIRTQTYNDMFVLDTLYIYIYIYISC